MSGDARRSGHKEPGCRGEWIDLTTLTDSRRIYRCPACGATRTGGVTDSYEGFEEPDPLTEDRRPTLRSILLWTVILTVVATVAYLLVVTAR